MAKKILLIAGPNGAGKTTLYRILCRRYPKLELLPFINPDEISKKLFGDYLLDDSIQSRRKMLAAGKNALAKREAYLRLGRSFGFESTFSGHTEQRTLDRAISLGYDLYLLYVALDDPYLNIQRIRSRIDSGGHFVSPDVVMKRYDRSLEHIASYLPKAKAFYLFDNTGERFRTVASYRRETRHHEGRLRIASSIPSWSVPLLDTVSCVIRSDETDS